MNESVGPLGAMLTSFMSPGVFKDVRRMNVGPLMMLLLLLALVPVVITSVRVYLVVHDGLRELAEGYDASLPPLRLEDGRAIVDGKVPAIYPNPNSLPEGDDTHAFVLIYDTTGNTKEIPEGYDAGFLVTSDTLICQDEFQRRELPLADLHQLTGDLVVDGEFFRQKQSTWSTMLTVLVAIVLTVGAVVAKLIQALLLGLLGMAAVRGHGSFTYGVSFKVAMVALAPAVLLDGALTLFGQHLPFLIYICVAIAYTWLGARRAADAGDGEGSGQGGEASWDVSRSSNPYATRSESVETTGHGYSDALRP